MRVRVKQETKSIILSVCAMLIATMGIIAFASDRSKNSQHPVEVVKEATTTSTPFYATAKDGVDAGLVTEAANEKEVTEYKSVLKIPKVDILINVYDSGPTKEDTIQKLNWGVVRHSDTVSLGANGVCVIAGHRSTIYDYCFNRLEKLEVGDDVYVYTVDQQEVEYRVTKIFEVEPSQNEILETTEEERGKSILRLYGCTVNGARRLVIECEAYNSAEEARLELDRRNVYAKESLKTMKLPVSTYDLEYWYEEAK